MADKAKTTTSRRGGAVRVTGWSVRPQGYVGLPVVGVLQGQALDLAYEVSGKRVGTIAVGARSGELVPEHRPGTEFGAGYRVHCSGRAYWLRATADLDAYVAEMVT